MKTYLTVRGIAKILDKERSTVIRWIQAGRLGQVKKIGGDYQIPQENFRRYWEESLVGIPERQQ